MRRDRDGFTKKERKQSYADHPHIFDYQLDIQRRGCGLVIAMWLCGAAGLGYASSQVCAHPSGEKKHQVGPDRHVLTRPNNLKPTRHFRHELT